MTKWLGFLFIGVIALALVACSASAGNNPNGDTQTASGSKLVANFDNALSVQGQLALGTMQLDGTDLAVSAEQAAELLPLWRVLQSLTGSDTAAQVEIDAVIRQIEGTMSAEQIQAIADLALTSDSLTELMESGQLQPAGFGERADQSAGAGDARGFPPEGMPPEGFAAGGPGGGPGGAIPGAGFGPGAGAELSEEDLATRQAAFESGEAGELQERLLANMVIRLLAAKTGEQVADPFGDVAATVFSIVGEATGLSSEELQAQLADGTTLAQLIEDNNGDLDAVRTALVEALSALPNTADLDPAQMADRWLGITQ